MKNAFTTITIFEGEEQGWGEMRMKDFLQSKVKNYYSLSDTQIEKEAENGNIICGMDEGFEPERMITDEYINTDTGEEEISGVFENYEELEEFCDYPDCLTEDPGGFSTFNVVSTHPKFNLLTEYIENKFDKEYYFDGEHAGNQIFLDGDNNCELESFQKLVEKAGLYEKYTLELCVFNHPN